MMFRQNFSLESVTMSSVPLIGLSNHFLMNDELIESTVGIKSQTSSSCNIQYDQYQITKKVVTDVQKDNEMRITRELKPQGFTISSILTHASS